jgi:hypothetical protein
VPFLLRIDILIGDFLPPDLKLDMKELETYPVPTLVFLLFLLLTSPELFITCLRFIIWMELQREA